jgi:type II secretory pathway pseudopilin PulG
LRATDPDTGLGGLRPYKKEYRMSRLKTPRDGQSRHYCLWRFKPGRNTTHVRRRKGFTLLEAVLAIFVLAATATVFFAMLPTAVKTGKMVGNHQQAASLVQHKIDQLRGIGYGRLTYNEMRDAGVIDSDAIASPFTFETVDGLDAIFVEPNATIAIEDFSTEVKQVTVTLTWTGSHAQQGNGTLTARALIGKG